MGILTPKVRFLVVYCAIIMKNDITRLYRNPNQNYTGISPDVLKDDYKSIAERQMLYEQSYRYYYDTNGDRLTFRDVYPEPDQYIQTNRKNMYIDSDAIENPGKSLEEFLGECDVCEN